MRLSVGKRIVELQQALRYQAERDFLTALMNRRGVMKYLEAEMEESAAKGTPLSIAVLDLDHFKRVNDTLGHSAGDDVLREVGRRILTILQEEACEVGRSGGEEFLLVFPGHPLEKARDMCEKIRGYIGERPVSSPKGEVSITASLGVAEYSGDGSLDDLVNRADSAMYQAKAEGRNRVCVGKGS
jgi:diguanylate cyclase (GGDEF)-like protein